MSEMFWGWLSIFLLSVQSCSDIECSAFLSTSQSVNTDLQAKIEMLCVL